MDFIVGGIGVEMEVAASVLVNAHRFEESRQSDIVVNEDLARIVSDAVAPFEEGIVVVSDGGQNGYAVCCIASSTQYITLFGVALYADGVGMYWLNVEISGERIRSPHPLPW